MITQCSNTSTNIIPIADYFPEQPQNNGCIERKQWIRYKQSTELEFFHTSCVFLLTEEKDGYAFEIHRFPLSSKPHDTQLLLTN